MAPGVAGVTGGRALYPAGADIDTAHDPVTTQSLSVAGPIADRMIPTVRFATHNVVQVNKQVTILWRILNVTHIVAI